MEIRLCDPDTSFHLIDLIKPDLSLLRNAGNRIGRLLGKKATDMEVLTELYMATLSRPPTEVDAKVALEHVNKAADKRKAWEDVHWALLNAKEFLFRH